MRQIDWWFDPGTYHGCSITGSIEVEDDATEERIEEEVWEDINNHISWGWKEA